MNPPTAHRPAGNPPAPNPPATNPPATIEELWRAGRSHGEAPFASVPGGGRWSWDEADRAIAATAAALAAAGARPGDVVAVQVDKSVQAVFVGLACLRWGFVLLPLNTAYTDAELAYLLGDATPALAVCDPARTAVFAAHVPRVLTLDAAGAGSLADAAAVAPPAPVPSARPADPAAVLYTSGTTGRPKGARLTQGNLTSNALALVEAWGFTADDVLLHVLPLNHAHGLFVAVHCVVGSGASMVVLPRFEVDAVLDHLGSCTVFMGVPTHYTRLLADPRLDRDRCRNVRLFVSGSAPLLAATHRAFAARTGHQVLERYGMTETLMITSNPLDGERRPGSVGRPLRDVEVRVVDDEDRPVPPGAVGAVQVRGPNVFEGYLNRPDTRLTEFTADGFFRTGDLGVLGADGYLTLVGRAKDLVITGGLNVYPTEVEDVLDALDGVRESAVVGVPDPDFGEAVVAVVVPDGEAPLDPAALRDACRARLAAYKVPKRVVVVEELPRNAMGKVEKARLRAGLTPPDAPS